MGPYAPTWPNHVRGRAGVEPPPKGVEFIALGSFGPGPARGHTPCTPPHLIQRGKSPNDAIGDGCRIWQLMPKSMDAPRVHPGEGLRG